MLKQDQESTGVELREAMIRHSNTHSNNADMLMFSVFTILV